LSAPSLDLAGALILAVGDREDVRVAGARLVAGTRSYYLIELRNLASVEPEFVRIAADDSSFLSPEDVVGRELCFNHGDGGANVHKKLFEAPLLAVNALEVATGDIKAKSRPSAVTFITLGKVSRFEVEVHSWHEPAEVSARWLFTVPADKPVVQARIRQYRYAGMPFKGDVTKTLPSGVETYDFDVGDGEIAKADSVVTVNYRIVLLDNQVLYNSKNDRQKPKFAVSSAPLEGLKQGIPGMRVGGLRKIVMPAEYAYGRAGQGNIPPGAMVVVDIGLESIH